MTKNGWTIRTNASPEMVVAFKEICRKRKRSVANEITLLIEMVVEESAKPTEAAGSGGGGAGGPVRWYKN